jgi:ubiquinone/menaquinone biosynthesis C-methylase UbiE
LSNEKKYIPALSFDFLTRHYDWIIKRVMPKGFRQILVHQINLFANEMILDFGTGTSEIAILLKKEIATSKIIGIDIDSKVLRIAKKKIKHQNLDIQVLEYDGTTFPFPDNYFDKVVSCLVFHHLSPYQKQIALDEIFRVLKMDGEIHIADWGLERNKIKAKFLNFLRYFKVLKYIVEHGRGLFPEYITRSGFKNLIETHYLKTRTGTLCYYMAKK